MRTFGTVQLPNRVVLPYAVQGSSGIPLLLVHAVGDSWRSFEGVLDHLPASVHTFAVTLRGHGDASRPESGYRSGDFAGDLVGFLDATGVRTAVIVGGSSGGLVPQRFAIDHPDCTSGLVLLGSPLSLGNKPTARELLDEPSRSWPTRSIPASCAHSSRAPSCDPFLMLSSRQWCKRV